jgi:hypothetical protein
MIVIIALAVFVESAELVATTVAVVTLDRSSGAVYTPELLMVPGPVELQVTVVFEVPETLADSCRVWDKEI